MKRLIIIMVTLGVTPAFAWVPCSTCAGGDPGELAQSPDAQLYPNIDGTWTSSPNAFAPLPQNPSMSYGGYGIGGALPLPMN